MTPPIAESYGQTRGEQMTLVIPDTERLTKARVRADQSFGLHEKILTELIAASIEAAFPVLLKQATGLNQDRAEVKPDRGESK